MGHGKCELSSVQRLKVFHQRPLAHATMSRGSVRIPQVLCHGFLVVFRFWQHIIQHIIDDFCLRLATSIRASSGMLSAFAECCDCDHFVQTFFE
jgi:hypothetical protein